MAERYSHIKPSANVLTAIFANTLEHKLKYIIIYNCILKLFNPDCFHWKIIFCNTRVFDVVQID